MIRFANHGEAVLVVGAFVVIAFVAITAVVISVPQRMIVVNGLDVPVTVEVGADRYAVGAHGHERIATTAGWRNVRVRAGDALVEELAVELSAGKAGIVNVLGAEPLVVTTDAAGRRPIPDVFRGGTSTFAAHVDVCFGQQLFAIQWSGRTALVTLGGGAATTITELLASGRRDDAALLLSRLARVQPRDPELRRHAHVVVEAQGLTALAAMWRDALTVVPDDEELNLTYQRVMRQLGRDAELLDRYRAGLERAPSSASARLLLAAVEDADAARARLDALLAELPEDAAARRLAAHLAWEAGDARRVVELLEGHERDDDDRVLLATALAVLGDRSRAARVATGISSAWSLPAALVRAQLDANEDEIGATPRDAHRAWVGSLRGASVVPPGGPLGEAVALQQMALRDPAAATLRVAQTPVEGLLWLHPPVVVLLAAELTRAADEARAQWLLAVTDVAPVPSRDLVDYVATGRSSATLRRLDPELRAALDLGRARVLAARGVESPGLRDAIVRADPLHGPVRIALETWPAPQPGPHERMAVLE